MKKIDSKFRHLTEEKALLAMHRQKELSDGAQQSNAELKAEENGIRQAREKMLKVDRRKFLDLASKSGISASLMRAFPLIGGVVSSRYAMAATTSNANKRVVYCYVPSGDTDDGSHWLPNSVGDKPWLSGTYADNGVANYCHFRKLHTSINGHGGTMGAMGGPSNYDPNKGPTIDARIAKVLGATTPINGLYLGAAATAEDQPQFQYISNMGSVQEDPAAVQNGILGVAKPGLATPDQAVLLAYDEQMRALASIKSKLSAEEFLRFSQHADTLAKIKANYIDASSRVPYTQVPINVANLLERAKTHAQIIAASLAAGVTNVATLQIGVPTGGSRFRSHENPGIDGHGIHGGGDAAGDFLRLHSYCYRVSGYLLKLLATTTGPDGMPLLSSTVFAQVTCFGQAANHSASQAPFLLATQRPEFRTGFSSSGANGGVDGSVRTFHNDIVKGLGLDTVVALNANPANVDLGLLK